MGYKVDLYIGDGSSGQGISKVVDQEELQGKTIGNIIEEMLNTAKGEYQQTAGIIRSIYKPGKVGIFEGEDFDSRPIELGDLALKTIREIDEAGEKRGRLHLIIQGAEIIGYKN